MELERQLSLGVEPLEPLLEGEEAAAAQEFYIGTNMVPFQRRLWVNGVKLTPVLGIRDP